MPPRASLLVSDDPQVPSPQIFAIRTDWPAVSPESPVGEELTYYELYFDHQGQFPSLDHIHRTVYSRRTGHRPARK